MANSDRAREEGREQYSLYGRTERTWRNTPAARDRVTREVVSEEKIIAFLADSLARLTLPPPVNKHVALVQGDITAVQCDAMVSVTDDHLGTDSLGLRRAFLMFSPVRHTRPLTSGACPRRQSKPYGPNT